ncbi:MAG: acetylxylan esterase [Planctomycetes bacterium]|nr:acetylxylan esterase [Planctomycetota bacterium]
MFPNLPLHFSASGYMDMALQFQSHVYGRSINQFRNWEAHKDTLKTPSDVEKWQRHVRSVALDAVGGLPLSGTPLNPRITGELKGSGFRVEKTVFESSPGVEVTSALYIPDGVTANAPAVLFVCGHSAIAKAYPPYQAVCHRLAQNGIVVLAVDPVGQGERKSYLAPDGSEIVKVCCAEHDYAGLQCWWNGCSAARYFVHDAMRGIDYLQSRPEVDPERIGVTGNSGGGTQTTWLMLLEPRLTCAAPGTFVMRRLEYMKTGQAQDSEQIIPGGTAAGLDHEDFLIAMAPRPVLVLAVEYDFFCIEGTRISVERARRIYDILGARDNLGLAVDRVTHEYSPPLARASTEFFCRTLLGMDPSAVNHSDPVPFPPEDLNCTRSGQVLLDNPSTVRTFDRNLAEYEVSSSRLAPENAASWLKDRILAPRRHCDLNPRWISDSTADGTRVSHGFWFTEPDVCNAGFLLRPADSPAGSVTIALFDHGTLDLDRRRPWMLDIVASGGAVLAVDPRGMGNILPRPISPVNLEERYGTVFKLISDLVYLGDDLASMRIFDVLRAIDLVRSDPHLDAADVPVRLFGERLSGVYAYVAAAIQPAVSSCEVEDSFFCLDSLMRTRYYHDDRLIQQLIFGMASLFDFPDLKPLFDGRELIITRPRDAAGRIME